MSISIVMPCYNEEAAIEKVVRSYYENIISKIKDSEFIVINDCSKDATLDILKRLEKELPKLRVLNTATNSGHGKAVLLGYEAAAQEFTFQVDSDNQFQVSDFWKLYDLKDSDDFILGVRKQRHDPIHRLILSRIINLFNFIFFGVRLSDANCPFRLIKTKVLKDLLKKIDPDTLAPNIFLSILARKKKIKMSSVPIIHYPRKTGTVSIMHWKLVKFCWKGLGQLIALRKVTLQLK